MRGFPHQREGFTPVKASSINVLKMSSRSRAVTVHSRESAPTGRGASPGATRPFATSLVLPALARISLVMKGPRFESGRRLS